MTQATTMQEVNWMHIWVNLSYEEVALVLLLVQPKHAQQHAVGDQHQLFQQINHLFLCYIFPGPIFNSPIIIEL